MSPPSVTLPTPLLTSLPLQKTSLYLFKKKSDPLPSRGGGGWSQSLWLLGQNGPKPVDFLAKKNHKKESGALGAGGHSPGRPQHPSGGRAETEQNPVSHPEKKSESSPQRVGSDKPERMVCFCPCSLRTGLLYQKEIIL